MNYNLIDIYQLMKENLDVHRDRNVQHFTTLSNKAWLKEFCTIKLSLSRQAGHTTLAKTLLTDDPEGTIVFVPMQNMVAQFDSDHVTTFRKILDQQYDKCPKTVIIDCASFLLREHQEVLYDNLAEMITKPDEVTILMLQ